MEGPAEHDTLKALVASGRVSPPAEEGDLLDEAPEDHGVKASESLAAMRDEDR